MLWGTLASAQSGLVGIFATNPADGSRSWAEVLFKLAWILFTQMRQRVSLGALECPVSHGPAEDSGHLGGQWAGRPAQGHGGDFFVFVSSTSSEQLLPS